MKLINEQEAKASRQYAILIVDDVPKNIQLVAKFLTGEGYELYFAQSGEAALKEVNARKFDLILLDVMMPEKDGYEVCAELKKNGVVQIALGGGEPLLHPDLVAIRELCRAYDLVPNLTTNGLGLSDEVCRALARCCGAVALSLEGIGEAFERRRGNCMSFTNLFIALAREAGRKIMELHKNDIRPSQIMTQEAFENAIAVDLAVGPVPIADIYGNANGIGGNLAAQCGPLGLFAPDAQWARHAVLLAETIQPAPQRTRPVTSERPALSGSRAQ